jgi:hypothetical protein
VDRVRPDDLEYYVEDGLIELRYADNNLYPLTARLSPHLALIDGEDRARRVDQLLAARSRQVWRLSAENVRLRVRLTDAEAIDSGGETLPRRPIDATNGAESSGMAAPIDLGTSNRGDVHAPPATLAGRLLSIVGPIKHRAGRLWRLLSRPRA